MAIIPENPNWSPDIYQIETDDKVLGGPDGKINLVTKQLADRTGFLKEGVEAAAGAASDAGEKADQALQQMAAIEAAAGSAQSNAGLAQQHMEGAQAALALTVQARNEAQAAAGQSSDNARLSGQAAGQATQKASEASASATAAVSAASQAIGAKNYIQSVETDIRAAAEAVNESIAASDENARRAEEAAGSAAGDAGRAETAANQAVSLVGSVAKAVLSYPDYAAASAAADTLPDGQVVIAEKDETNGNDRVLYSVENGLLVSGLSLDTKLSPLNFTNYADIFDAAPRLAVGQVVDSIYDQMRYDIGIDGQVINERPIVPDNDYSKILAYTGRATRLKVIDNTGAHWWVRRGSAESNDGTILKDALGRSWEREYSGAVDVKWFGAKGDAIAEDRDAIKKAIAASEAILFSPGKYRVTASDYDSGTDWRHHFVVPSNRTMIFEGAEIITNTSFATRAVIFLVRGSNVEFNNVRTNDLNTTSSSFVIPIGAGSTYDSSYPAGEFSELYINNGVFKNSWLSVSVQFGKADGGNKSFRCIRVNNSESFARPGNTSSGNFNFRCDEESLWKVKDVQLDTCRGYNGATASTFNFVGVDGFSHTNCTSYYNLYAGTELENGCQDGTISNFRSVDDAWGVWIDDSRRIAVNGVTHKTISETVVSPLLGTFSRYREAIKISRQGFPGHTDWKTEGIEISGVVSDFGRFVIGAYGASPAGEFGCISVRGMQLNGDGVARASGNTVFQAACPSLVASGILVRGAPTRSIELSIPSGGKHQLTDVRTETVAGESSIGLYTVGTGRLSLLEVDVHSESLSHGTTDSVGYRVNGVARPMRQGGQQIHWNVTGSPEGVISSGPGSLALRADDGSLYVKKTGTGNTGWGRVTVV